MKLLAFTLLTLITRVAWGQVDKDRNNISKVDSIHKAIAVNYLSSKFGQGFVNKYLTFDTIQPYSSMLATFEVKGHRCMEGKNMVVVYFNHNVIDTVLTKVTKKQISNCYGRKNDCQLFIDRASAIEIAKKAGLKIDSVTHYIVTLVFWKDNKKDIRWDIVTGKFNFNSAYNVGRSATINAKTGNVELGDWQSIP